MEPDFVKYFPPEIITILKLSVRTIAVSKCVCKSWLKLLETDDFISSHFAQSAPALALTMKEYGVGESWRKEYVIDLGGVGLDALLADEKFQRFHPVKVFNNGDVLLWFQKTLFYYSKKTRNSREVGGMFVSGEEIEFEHEYITSMHAVLHTPSMVSLKCFAPVENVVSF